MKQLLTIGLLLGISASAWAQDQQLGARTKGMGGSYTAFEDDPVAVWLNPAGIARQPDQMSVQYQTYTAYPLNQDQGPGNTIVSSVGAETIMADPSFFPSYLGFVFQLGDVDSPMAIGLCVARPFHLNYALDQVTDPFQTTFQPEANVEEGLLRYRVAIARDFALRKIGDAGFLNHVAVGLGLDLGNVKRDFKDASGLTSEKATSVGFGLGVLVGLYDNTEDFKVNFGIAYQSSITFNFDTNPSLIPAFDMPQQLNVGAVFYMMQGMPLRITIDFQWIDWSATAQEALFSSSPNFEDAINYSIGFEYRFKVSDKVRIFPRLGIRRFDAPWNDPDNLPMTGAYKLVLDTKAEAFTLFTVGLGVLWTAESTKSRSVDIGADFGGDSYNVAIGYTQEF